LKLTGRYLRDKRGFQLAIGNEKKAEGGEGDDGLLLWNYAI
jgi:hypothetical protein